MSQLFEWEDTQKLSEETETKKVSIFDDGIISPVQVVNQLKE